MSNKRYFSLKERKKKERKKERKRERKKKREKGKKNLEEKEWDHKNFKIRKKES